ncbi:uncharacterized protein LOC127750432 [Frankliniella occidentalis]|uniref:Uncharacterized protein LOC127750432 n=1 Tax=Frankliniella occidentalis TaxID=133901 RepID=A0A9C6X2S9_FRAOC|nr:uncharacterized protein LOC127750432 [Frankliniella occidentalis]
MRTYTELIAGNPAIADEHDGDRLLQMAQLVNSGSFDLGQLSTLMEETYPARCKWIIQEGPLWSAVQERYPALKSAKFVREEFKRVIPSSDKLEVYLTEQVKTNIVQRVNSVAADTAVELLLDKLQCACSYSGDDLSTTICIAALPVMMKECMRHWVSEDDGTKTNNPYVRVLTSKGKYGEGAEYVPMVEGVRAVTDQNLSIRECFILLAQIIHILALAYPKQTFKSWKLLSEVYLNIQEDRRLVKKGKPSLKYELERQSFVAYANGADTP